MFMLLSEFFFLFIYLFVMVYFVEEIVLGFYYRLWCISIMEMW